MKLYMIKGTYTGGEHEGKSFLIGKGGYVIADGSFKLITDCFSEKSAKMVSTRYNKRNEWDSQHCSRIDPVFYEPIFIREG